MRRADWVLAAVTALLLCVVAAASGSRMLSGQTIITGGVSRQSVSSGLSCNTIDGRTTCKDGNGHTVPGVPVSSIKGTPNCAAIVNDMAYSCGPPAPPTPPIPPISFPPCFPFCGAEDFAADSSDDGD